MANLKDLIVNGSARILGNLYATLKGNADTATKLETARTIRVNLGSSSAVGFDGTANITPGMYGTLPVANGGTGQTSIANIQAGKDGDGNVISTTYAKTSSLNNYVDLTSNQTIGGTKTFSSTIARVTNSDSTSAPSTYYETPIIQNNDKNGILNTSLRTGYRTNGNIVSALYAGNNGINNWIGIEVNTSGVATTKAPTPTEDTISSTQIDTVGARNTKLQNYLQTNDQSDLLPNFDVMPVLQTIEFDTSDSNWHTILTRTNTETNPKDVVDCVYFRITVTGTNINQVADCAWIMKGQANSNPTLLINYMPGTSDGAYSGFRYIREIYPKALNNGYKWALEVLQNRNNNARHYKIQVFKTNSNYTWTQGTASTFNGTYHNAAQYWAETTSGYFISYLNGTVGQASNAGGINDRLNKVLNTNFPAGEALLANQFVYMNNNKHYPATNKTLAIEPGYGIQFNITAYNVNNDVGWDRLRQKQRVTSLTNIPHATLARGNPCYFRCTMDSNGNILSDNYVATSMANGYTWYYVGIAESSTAIALDTTQSFFITLDSNGKVTHINGKQVCGSGASWGSITGTLSNQTDLNNALNAKANDSDVVKLTGNQTIGGTKTIQDFSLVVKSTGTDDEASSITSNREYGILIQDKNGSRIGNFYGGQLTNGNIRTYMCACRPVNGSVVYKYAEIQQSTDGKGHFNINCDTTQAPTPATSNSTSATNIATIGWVNDASKSTNVVHRTGNETIGGTKTFSETINGTALKAFWADLAENYKSDTIYEEGTLIEFGGNNEITIANKKVNGVISSKPALLLNSKEKGQPVALAGKVPVKVEGKINKFDKLILKGNGIARKKKWYEFFKRTIAISLEENNNEGIKKVLCVTKFNLD